MTFPELFTCSVGALILGAGCCCEPLRVAESRAAADGEQASTRVGYYESRAIALAYFRSAHNTRLPELQAAYEAAKKDGDKEKITKLGKQFGELQEHVHRQVFGSEPVEDCLDPIRYRLPEIMRDAKVDRLERLPANGKPEGVDVTDILVREYQPTDDTLRTVAEIRKHPPLRPPYPRNW